METRHVAVRPDGSYDRKVSLSGRASSYSDALILSDRRNGETTSQVVIEVPKPWLSGTRVSGMVIRRRAQ